MAKRKETTPHSADKRGLKRICSKCSTRFYDFFEHPPVCPSCKTEFTPIVGGRAPAKREESKKDNA